MITSSGNIFYQDEFETFYRTIWETVGDQIDITSTVYTPYVWGEEKKGYIQNGILFRRGMVSVTRQVLRFLDDGYEIVAEGGSQFEDYIQMNFPCETGPTDNFAYHLDCMVTDETDFLCSDGPCWTDISDSVVTDTVWCDVDTDGSIIPSATYECLTWIDVWADGTP